MWLEMHNISFKKHQGVLQDLLERSQSLQLEINSLQAQVEAAKAASASVVPPTPPPSVPPEGTPPVNADDPSGVQIREIQEGDEEMEEVDEEEDNRSGVGAFLAPPRRRRLRKLSSRNLTRRMSL